ncbi:MAG: caspase family protein [Candidatus Thorarchaeota archaeon]
MKSLWGKAWEGAVYHATKIITDLKDQLKIYRAWWHYFKGHALYLRYKSTNQGVLLNTALECFKQCHQDTLDITPLLLHNFIEKSHIDNLFISPETEKELIQKSSKALLIGIDSYQDANINKLSSCIHDVEEIKKILIDPSRCGYSPENVIVLHDTTKDKIIYNLQEFSKISGNSTVIIYFSGHGTHKDGKPYLASELTRFSC